MPSKIRVYRKWRCTYLGNRQPTAKPVHHRWPSTLPKRVIKWNWSRPNGRSTKSTVWRCRCWERMLSIMQGTVSLQRQTMFSSISECCRWVAIGNRTAIWTAIVVMAAAGRWARQRSSSGVDYLRAKVLNDCLIYYGNINFINFFLYKQIVNCFTLFKPITHCRKYVQSKPHLPWISMYCSGFDHSPISFGHKEHTLGMSGGDNSYVIVVAPDDDCLLTTVLGSNKQLK